MGFLEVTVGLSEVWWSVMSRRDSGARLARTRELD